MKKCFKCLIEKDISEFYVHPKMGDGTLNKCKICTLKDAKENRLKNLERIRAYDRARGNRQTYSYHSAYAKRYKRERPLAYIAGLIFFNAVRRGEITRQDCAKCGKKNAHGHHEDYRKPLDVIWLCGQCHRQRHAKIKAQGIDLHYK